MSKDDIVTIYADILQVTDAAVLADCAGEEVWLPLSQVDFFGEKGDVGVIMTLPEWLADEKGLSDGDGVRRGAVPPSNESESSSAEEEPHICETCDHVEGFFCYSQREDDSCPDPCAKCHRLFDDPTDDESYPDHWCPQPQEEDEVSGVAQAPASPAEASFLKTETITVSIPLDLEERESVGDRMACALEQIAALEDDLDSYRKRINAEIKSLQKDAERARKEWQEATSVDDKMSLDTDLESAAEHQEEPSEEGFFDPSTGAITSMISAASHDDAPMLPQ